MRLYEENKASGQGRRDLTLSEKERLRRRFPEFIGNTETLFFLLQDLERISSSEAPVLIQGESGTGKELVARAIHRISPRRSGPFVGENCAAMAPHLLEDELFGHEKGAFTGARGERAGLVESSHGGILFLDEITETRSDFQSKLLRVIQEKEIRRLGSNRPRSVDFRLITATHRDPEQEVESGTFREDLRYRIDVLRLHLPPLRQRRQDIPLLCQFFLGIYCRRLKKPTPRISTDAMTVLIGARWRGNIRELQNEMERIANQSHVIIHADHLSPSLQQQGIPHPIALKLRAEVGTDLRKLEKIVLGGIVRDVLRETDGNKAQAARILGIPKTTLYRRLDRYGVLRSFGSQSNDETI
ncbi:MAG: AAA domain-containing protein [Planctomycetia bacterium]|nr:AAA domain-containing protein [Planctomycetia bacterium]